ncbi:ORF6N domain-containing protein [Pedobacter sp. L105]|uniref:ORF6N domain-containing protein n=1 Tax=Pedobacter sp. L105 TaxID=1641871 RepID=UPI00131D4AD1|nr:ORF6N domain-containing protein [Pedobacter sp. L105]
MNSRESQKNTVTDEMIMNRIYVLRGQKVMIDIDLAVLYQIDVAKMRMLTGKKTGRFPDDFMFRLNLEDYDSLKRQDSTVNRNTLLTDFPFAFTDLCKALHNSVYVS